MAFMLPFIGTLENVVNSKIIGVHGTSLINTVSNTITLGGYNTDVLLADVRKYTQLTGANNYMALGIKNDGSLVVINPSSYVIDISAYDYLIIGAQSSTETITFS